MTFTESLANVKGSGLQLKPSYYEKRKEKRELTESIKMILKKTSVQQQLIGYMVQDNLCVNGI